MAKAGNFTAYQQLKPIQDNDELGRAEQNAFRYRREKADQDAAKKKEATEFAEKMGASISTLRAEAIGINSIDEMNAKVLLEGKQRLQKAWEKRKANPDDLQAIMEIANLEKLPDDIVKYQKQYSDWANTIATGVNEGKYSASLNRELVNKISSSVADLNAVFKLDESGSLVGAMVDPERDDVMEFKTIKSVMDGSGLERPIAVADYDASQLAIKKMYNTHKVEQTDPNNKWGSISTDQLREEDVQGIIDNTNNVWGEYNEMTDFAKSIIADKLQKNPNSISEEVYNQYKQDFADEIIGSYKTTKSEDNGFKDQQANSRAWAALNKDKGSGKKDEKQQEADFLKTTIDGALSGDEKYVSSLADLLSGSDDVIIENTEYLNGKLIIGLDDGTDIELDPKDPSSVGKLLGLIRPDEKADVRLGLYEQGKLLVDQFNEGTKTGNSEIVIDNLVENLPENDKDAVKVLNDKFPNAFKATGIINNVVKGPDGTEYRLDNETDRQQLKDFMMNYDPDDTEGVASSSKKESTKKGKTATSEKDKAARLAEMNEKIKARQNS